MWRSHWALKPLRVLIKSPLKPEPSGSSHQAKAEVATEEDKAILETVKSLSSPCLIPENGNVGCMCSDPQTQGCCNFRSNAAT